MSRLQSERKRCEVKSKVHFWFFLGQFGAGFHEISRPFLNRNDMIADLSFMDQDNIPVERLTEDDHVQMIIAAVEMYWNNDDMAIRGMARIILSQAQKVPELTL